MKLIKQGCLTNAGLSLLVGVLSLILTILTGREALSQEIAAFQQSTADLPARILATLTAPISVPLVIFFLLMVCSIRWLLRILRTDVSPQSRREFVNFRDLLLVVEWDKNQIPHVLNRSVTQAKCGHDGDCLQDIVGSDSSGYGWVNYLKCRDGHYVGNERKYEDFIKEQEAQKRQMEEDRNRENEKLKREYEQMVRDKEAGKITQEELDKWEQEQARPASKGGFYTGTRMTFDKKPADSEQEFYSHVVDDFEREEMRKHYRGLLKPGT